MVDSVITFVNVYDLPGHGRCECRKCICDTNYTGSACDCSLETSTCLAKNGQICNGRGTCECGICKCTDPKFQGPTCEICPTCPGVCVEHKWVWSLHAWLELEDVDLPFTNLYRDSIEYNAKRRKTPYSVYFFSQRLCAMPSIWGWWEEGYMSAGLRLLQNVQGEGPRWAATAHRPELPSESLQTAWWKWLLVLLHLRHQEPDQGGLRGGTTWYDWTAHFSLTDFQKKTNQSANVINQKCTFYILKLGYLVV